MDVENNFDNIAVIEATHVQNSTKYHQIRVQRGGWTSETDEIMFGSHPRYWDGYVDVICDEYTLIQCLSTFLPGLSHMTTQIRHIRLPVSPAKSRRFWSKNRIFDDFLTVASLVWANQGVKWHSPGRNIVVSDQINLPDTPLVPIQPSDLCFPRKIFWGKLNLVLWEPSDG